jgi:hypothetical protein
MSLPETASWLRLAALDDFRKWKRREMDVLQPVSPPEMRGRPFTA